MLHYAVPWLSEKDIDAGERWAAEIGKRLEESNFGIICLAQQNLDAPWILFEAGALSKALQTASVCPYLLDVDFKDVSGPLAQFQAKKAERTQTLELLQAINAKAPTPIDAGRLTELFEVLWPKLEQALNSIPAATSAQKRIANQTDVIEDLVAVVRGFDHRFRRLETSVLSMLDERPVGRDVTIEPGLFRVKVKVNDDITVSADRREFIVELPERRLIEGIARLTGLDAEKFDDTWYILDANTKNVVRRSELLRFVRNTLEPAIVLTTIPF